MGIEEVSHSKQPVELVGSVITQDGNGNDCIRSCGETSITGGRAVSASFAEIPITSTGWTDLLAPFTDVLVLSIQNKTGLQVKVNSNNAESGYKGMILEDDEERNYNDLDTGFALYAKLASGTGSLFVEVLKNA